MNIAYVVYPGACFLGEGDGIKMQAKIWGEELKKRGHRVSYIDPWSHYSWKDFDIVHIFGIGLWNYDFIHWGSGLNPRVVFSPIIDTNTPLWKYRLATFFGCEKLRLFSQNYVVRRLRSDIRLFFARTEYEAKYLEKGYDISRDKIAIVPLSYRSESTDIDLSKKEKFCMFAGTMTQERKNVGRLIEAAKRFGFKLVLVGNTGNAQSLKNLKNKIGDADNIEIKGYVSDEELESLYLRAKVFALPSINEGVGLVALEAAMHGCNIVITNIGGPKEYYPDKLAYKVNPYDIDDIGNSILKALNDNIQQPKLSLHIRENYNLDICIDMLLNKYKQVCAYPLDSVE